MFLILRPIHPNSYNRQTVNMCFQSLIRIINKLLG